MDASSNHAETELPVQKQLEAYNARDIDAFMQWWADDCQYYEFLSRLLASGAAEIRERHVARFKEPNLHGTLVKRVAVANIVVDQETVTRTFPDAPGEVDVVAIYEVEDNRIAKAWFKMGPPRLHPATEIRRALPPDALAVRELTRAAYAKWVSVIGREPTPMTVDYVARVRDHRIELLHAGGRLAALIELLPEADLPADRERGSAARLPGAGTRPPTFGPCRGSRGISRLFRHAPLHKSAVRWERPALWPARLPSGLGGTVQRRLTVYMSKQLHSSSKTAP